MSQKSEKAIPRSRISRLARMARMTTGIATGVLAEGARQLSKGNRPALSDMLLTPANAKRLATQLSAMRGAAMKVGQLLSMEAGELLPQELSTILAQLRDKAFTMPRRQLLECLENNYGAEWRTHFTDFDLKPLAAASIGQVHRATTLSGDSIVVKIQYPGVKESIDSDVDNIASLLRITNILPEHLDISALLQDAKRQLHDEANYLLEADFLRTFGEAFREDRSVAIPKVFDDLTTATALAMEYMPSVPIESIVDDSRVDRNNIMQRLFEIFLREFFDLKLMQTDANFANFRYQAVNDTVVLLDFGATRPFPQGFVTRYSELLIATIKDDEAAMLAAADSLGYEASVADEAYQNLVLSVFRLIFEPFMAEGDYDFAKGGISQRLSEFGEQAYDFKRYWQTPPTDILYLHRKLGGMYLLAARLKARVDCASLLAPFLDSH